MQQRPVTPVRKARFAIALASLSSPALMWLAAILLATSWAGAANALELVLYDKAGCVWCARWERDVGRVYPESEESRDAPLRRVDIRDQRRSGVDLAEPVIYTPTFVLSDHGEEIGRITGYQSVDVFWGKLDDLLQSRPRRRPDY